MFGGRMRMSVRFAVTHFGHSQISADTSSHQLRANRTQACWRDDGFDLFHLSILVLSGKAALAARWQVLIGSCTIESEPIAATARSSPEEVSRTQTSPAAAR